jgi:hypothetical protein
LGGGGGGGGGGLAAQDAIVMDLNLSPRALSINTAKPARTVKLLNETQNIWASDLSDRKILITLE